MQSYGRREVNIVAPRLTMWLLHASRREETNNVVPTSISEIGKQCGSYMHPGDRLTMWLLQASRREINNVAPQASSRRGKQCGSYMQQGVKLRGG